MITALSILRDMIRSLPRLIHVDVCRKIHIHRSLRSRSSCPGPFATQLTVVHARKSPCILLNVVEGADIRALHRRT